jgi:hypothetical protein
VRTTVYADHTVTANEEFYDLTDDPMKRVMIRAGAARSRRRDARPPRRRVEERPVRLHGGACGDEGARPPVIPI